MNTSTETSTETSHGELLDRIYRLQRHIYDFTRKYYLFGRDRLLREMLQTNTSSSEEPPHILEVGCGTGRNLRIAHKIQPQAKYYGLDASQEMLKHAVKMVLPIRSHVELDFGYAESFSGETLFGQSTFDIVFFSYSLTMIPDWKGAIDNALNQLSPGGSIWIVDFWDQADYPKWFQSILQKWLALFHVRFEPALIQYIEELASSDKISLEISPVGRRYAYIAKITPNKK